MLLIIILTLKVARGDTSMHYLHIVDTCIKRSYNRMLENYISTIVWDQKIGHIGLRKVVLNINLCDHLADNDADMSLPVVSYV